MSTSEEHYRARHAAPRAALGQSAALRRTACAAAAVAAGAVPLAGAGVAHAATAPFGSLGGVLPAGVTQNAALAPLDHELANRAQQLTDRLASAFPVDNVFPAVVRDAVNPLSFAPNLLRSGALGNLSQGLAPQTQDLTGAVVRQTAPLVDRLHQTGVPTVGDVTGQVSQADLPGVGTVGGLTKWLPVTSALGPDSPVPGALNNVSAL